MEAPSTGSAWSEVYVHPEYDAEQALIGSILLDADSILPEAETMLEPEDFYFPEYRTLYRTMSGHFFDGKPVDHVTLAAQLGEEYREILLRAAQSVPHCRNWRSYAQIVVDTAKRRRAVTAAERLLESISAGENIADSQQRAVKICEALSETRDDRTVSAAEGYTDFYASLDKPVDYLRTGFSKLDKYVQIQRGDFVVVGARPSVGKTALTLQMLMHMSRDCTAVYFSLETSAKNIFGRIASCFSGVPLECIKSHTGVDYLRLADAGKEIRQRQFYVVEAAGWTVAQIKAKAIQLGAQLIFVDYMGLVRDEAQGRYEKLTNISIGLHTLAQQSQITVIALSQLNREGRGEPTMESLRESGQIEQDADAILLLHAPDDIESEERKIIVAKNKEGRVGCIECRFDGTIQKFSELETRY